MTDLSKARGYFSQCCAASRAHTALVRAALGAHGDHGPQISGVIRDHFPETTKLALRALCDEINASSALAWDSRPPRVRMSTIRNLGREVARVEGCGFYGPQP